MAEPKKRGRKPKKRNMYFTLDTQDAIVRFNNSTDQLERDKIYRDEPDIFHVKESKYTTCELENPHYYFYTI